MRVRLALREIDGDKNLSFSASFASLRTVVKNRDRGTDFSAKSQRTAETAKERVSAS